MKRLILFLLTCLAVFSCDEGVERIELTLMDFSIEVPINWTLIESNGYDSYVWNIKINEQEIIGIDLGSYSNNLNVDASIHEIIYTVIDGREAKIVRPKYSNLGTTGVYFASINIDGRKLQLSGINLSERNQAFFIDAIGTIKFK